MSRPTASLCSMLLITDMVLVELELAKQWISLLRSVLGCFSGLIHHIRAPESWSGPLTSLSPRGWWAGPTVTAIIPRQFQQVSKPPLGASPPLAPLWITVSSLWAGGQAPDLTVAAEHQDGPTDGGCPTHRIQCSSSVLSAPCTPLTPASCWHALWHTFPLLLCIFLHLCLPLTLGPVNAGGQQSCTSVRYQIGNRVYCLTSHPFFWKAQICVCVCVKPMWEHTTAWNKVHLTTEKTHTHTWKHMNT